MRRDELRAALAWAAVGWVLAAPQAATGGVTHISGVSIAEVRQFHNGVEIQSDFAQESLPGTATFPPITARARLDQLSQIGLVRGAGQVASVFNLPILTGLIIPDDVGMDVGAFGDDPMTTWFVRGQVIETRSVRIEPAELGLSVVPDVNPRLRSRVLISGVLVITALDPNADLTGTEAILRMRVTRRSPSLGSMDPISGEVVFRGGPGGTVTVFGTGVFSNILLPIVDLTGALPAVPLVKAVVFAGLGLPYEYDIALSEDFELVLDFESEVHTLPAGVGVAGVFGLPQAGLDAIFSRVKQDDRGARVSELIAEYVDTTGQAYVGSQPPATELVPTPPALCGLFGVEAVGLVGTAFWLVRHETRRRPGRRGARSR